MFCPHCGEQISAQAEICPKCGVRISNGKVANLGEDKPNIAVNILSFCCFPLLGIILFFVWKDSKPVSAKSALIWSLISIGLYILLGIILPLIIGFFSAMADPYSY